MNDDNKTLDKENEIELDDDVLSDRRVKAEREAELCREKMKELLAAPITLVCAVMQSVAALTAFFRGINIVVAFALFIVYGLFAAGFWMLHLEAKRITKIRSHGSVLLSAITAVQTLVTCAVLLFALLFTAFGVFGKKIFVFMPDDAFNAVSDLGFWSILLFVLIVLAAYLAKQYLQPKNIFYLNLNDALEIDVAFSLYAYRFGRANFYLAAANIVYFIFRYSYPSFSDIPIMPEKLSRVLDMYAVNAGHGVLGLIFTLVCSVSLVCTGVFAFKYVGAAKKIQID